MTKAEITPHIMRQALWSVVANEARKRRSRRPLWARVSDLCGLGSTYSEALCVELGFHQDTGEKIRERGWEPEVRR